MLLVVGLLQAIGAGGRGERSAIYVTIFLFGSPCDSCVTLFSAQ